MSTAFAFDSYAYVRKLRDAGMDEAQAVIQAEALISLAEDRLATKQDVAELRRDIAESTVRIATVEANLKRDVETTKAELRKDIALARVTTIQWTAGTFAAQTVLIIGAMFAVMRMNQPTPPTAYQPPAQELRQPVPAPVPPPSAPATR